MALLTTSFKHLFPFLSFSSFFFFFFFVQTILQICLCTRLAVFYLHIYFYVSRILTQSQVGPADIRYGPRIFCNEIQHRQTSFALVVARSDTRCLHTSARDTTLRFRRARRANRLLLLRVCVCEFLSRYVLVIETVRKTPINGMIVCRL